MTIFQNIGGLALEGARRVPVLLSALAFFLIYIPAAFHGYGFFVDELYYLAGATRPAMGYVDHPPLSIWILYLSDADSLEYIRFFPALCGAFTVYLAASFVRVRLGSPLSQFLAGVCVLAAPVLLVLFGFYSMNAFEVLLVTVLVLLVSEMIRRERQLWIWFGIVAGFAVLNKHTSLVYILALLVGLACTRERKLLFHKSILWGGLAAFLIVLPNIIWQMQNSFASLEFYGNASSLKNVTTMPHMVVVNQVLSANPFTLLVWAAGLLYCWKSEFRALAIAYMLCLLLLIVVQSSRPDRIAAFYPSLFAAGALWLEERKLLRGIATGLALTGLLVFGALGLPVLEPETAARYAAFIRVVPAIEAGKRSALPQWYADRLGWPEAARRASELAKQSGPDTIVIAATYGLAGAVEKFGDVPVISPHNAYHIWASEKDLKSYKHAVLLGFDKESAGRFCKPEDQGTIERPYSRSVQVLRCETGGKLAEIWPEIRKLM